MDVSSESHLVCPQSQVLIFINGFLLGPFLPFKAEYPLVQML